MHSSLIPIDEFSPRSNESDRK